MRGLSKSACGVRRTTDPALLVVTRRLEIRPVALPDAEDTARLMTPAVARNLLSWSAPMGVAEARRRIRESQEALSGAAPVNLAMVLRESLKLIGWIGVWRPARHRLYRLGFWLGEPYQACGLMTEALAASLPVIMWRLRISAIEAEAFEDNVSSIHVLDHVGMRRCGAGILSSRARSGPEPTIKFRLQ